MSRNKNKRSGDILCTIFNIDGITNSSKVHIKQIASGYMQSNKKISDTQIKSYNISNNIFAQLFRCNITNSFLVTTKKLPVMYINVWWSQSIRKILLYRLFLYFTIKENIESSDQLLKNEIEGKFTMEVMIEGKTRAIDEFETYLGNGKMENILINFTTSDDIKVLHNELITTERKKIADKYAREFEDYKTLPKATISLKDIDLDNF